jgi:DNA polymerase III epsilon subunit-like protein
MMIHFWDTEANGLLDTVDKIHCLSFKRLNEDMMNTVHNDFNGLFRDGDTWIAHNQFSYDLPLLVKLGIIKDFTVNSVTTMDDTIINVQFIDTLALSREHFPDRPRGHGLLPWSKELGTYKPQIDDWENLELKDYIERCEEDVLSTEAVFLFLADKLGIEI